MATARPRPPLYYNALRTAIHQFIGVTDGNVVFSFPDAILEQLSPETRELTEFAPWGRVKDIVNRDVVSLS